MSTTPSIHNLSAKNIKGELESLDKYKGKVLLIVNTASKCGFTPQLEDMTKLHEEFKEQGFEILAFPSNDFAGQEPLEMAKFLLPQNGISTNTLSTKKVVLLTIIIA